MRKWRTVHRLAKSPEQTADLMSQDRNEPFQSLWINPSPLERKWWVLLISSNISINKYVQPSHHWPVIKSWWPSLPRTKQFPKDNLWLLQWTELIVQLYAGVCKCVLKHTCMWISTCEGRCPRRTEVQDPWSWNYKQLCTAWQGSRGPNVGPLAEQQGLLTARSPAPSTGNL